MSGRLNVLVLVLDALRARNMSCYGYPLCTTPGLDEFASQGVQFKNAYTTASWTIPSHASMLSGLYLTEHRVESIKQDRRFSSSIVPLPGALRRYDYKTAAFSQNPLFGPAHSFDYFDEYYGEYEFSPSSRGTGVGMLAKRATNYLQKLRSTRGTLARVQNWIEAHHTDTRFFAVVNLMTTHYPWAPSPRAVKRVGGFPIRSLMDHDSVTLKPWEFNSGRRNVEDRHRLMWLSLYNAAIAHLDREVSRFFGQLRKWRGYDETVIVVTSDHGEMLGDYRDTVGHMLSLHDNIMWVPLLIRHPDYRPGTVAESVVQTLGLYPSVLEWAGVPDHDIPRAQLRSVRYSEAVTADSPSGYAFAEEDYRDSYDIVARLVEANPSYDSTKHPRRQVAVHTTNYKYIWADSGTEELYDLGEDRLETHNLAAQESHSAVKERLRRAREDWEAGLRVYTPEPFHTSEVPDPKVIEQLRALGYVE